MANRAKPQSVDKSRKNQQYQAFPGVAQMVARLNGVQATGIDNTGLFKRLLVIG